MSEYERGKVRVRLDELMSEAQIEIVRSHVFGQLIGQAGDLDVLNKYPDPKKAIREVAVLGRLSYWLEMGEILVPDRHARKLMRQVAREVDGMNADGESTGGGDPEVEHDAFAAYIALFSQWPETAEVRDAFWQKEHHAEQKGGGGK